MEDTINIIEIGDQDSYIKLDTEYFNIDYLSTFEISRHKIDKLKKRWDVFVITSDIPKQYIIWIKKYLEAYKTLIIKGCLEENTKNLIFELQPIEVDKNSITLIDQIRKRYFGKQFGDKIDPSKIKLDDNFNAKAKLCGKSKFVIDVDKKGFLQWDTDIFLHTYDIDIWLEFLKSKTVSFTLQIIYTSAETAEIKKIINLEDTTLVDQIHLSAEDEPYYLTFSLDFRGKGVLSFGNLHFRRSRNGIGDMIPGGERLVDSSREELFIYFNPGNLIPPLNVYFSGYRSAEGFEGYSMIKDLKHPFILISDPRLEGGKFYASLTNELENKVISYIRNKLALLNFKQNDLILLGLSMGAAGAIYYASKLNPKNVIVGKPLINLNLMISNTSVNRPDDFLTALDIGESLRIKENDLIKQSLNPDLLKNTSFHVVYMIDDDYDNTAFSYLQKIFFDKVKLVGRGFKGRHNDETNRVIQWFLIYYREVEKNWII